jgi:hypothetical protein
MNDFQNHPLTGAANLDSAMTKLWAFYKKYFVGMYIISVVLALLTSLASAGIDASMLQTVTDPEEMLQILKGMAGPYALILLISFVFGVILHAWVLERPLGEPGFPGTLLKKSALALIPYLLVMIVLMTIGMIMTAFGLVLLVLPGIFALFYIATVTMFALPLTLAESRNPAHVLSRSFTLAHRNLWPNMGWVIVVMLIILVVSLVIGAILMVPFTGTFLKSFTNPEEATTLLDISRNPVYIILSALTTSLVTPVFPILAFILYFRNREEEVQQEEVADSEERLKVEDLYPKTPDNQ